MQFIEQSGHWLGYGGVCTASLPPCAHAPRRCLLWGVLQLLILWTWSYRGRVFPFFHYWCLWRQCFSICSPPCWSCSSTLIRKFWWWEGLLFWNQRCISWSSFFILFFTICEQLLFLFTKLWWDVSFDPSWFSFGWDCIGGAGTFKFDICEHCDKNVNNSLLVTRKSSRCLHKGGGGGTM